MNAPRSRSFRDYLLLLRRFRGRVLAVFAGTVLVGAAYWFLAPREFQSEAKLFVRVGRENAALDPTVMTQERVSLNSTREIEINSIVEHLRSRGLLEKVLQTVDPDSAGASPEEKEESLRGLERAVYVTSPRASTIIAVQSTADDPGRAQRIAAAVVDVYLEQHMRINRAAGAYPFFVEQGRLLKEELAAAQGALRDAKNKAGMASVEGRRAALERQTSDVESQIHQVTAGLSAAEAKVAALKTAVDSVPEPLLRQMIGGTPSDGLAGMREQLFQLRIREQEALSKYTEAHPITLAVRAQAQEVEGALKGREPPRQEVFAALSAQDLAGRASLAAQKTSLQAQLAQLHTDLAALNRSEVVLEDLAREVKQRETRYLACVKNMEEARMDEALRAGRISNVSVFQSATFAPRPVRPRTLPVAAVTLLAACLAAFGVALLSEGSGGALSAGRRADRLPWRLRSEASPEERPAPAGKNGDVSLEEASLPE